MTHTYSIVDLKRNISTGLVTKVCWQVITTDNENRWVHCDEFLTTGNETDEGFIAYDQLTESDILGWLDANIDKPTLEPLLEAKLSNSLTTSKGTPWTI